MTKLAPETDSLILTCACSDSDHMVEFSLEDWPGPKSSDSLKLIVRPLLNPSKSFLPRLRIALRYLFKRPTRSFDSVAVYDEESIDSLDRLLKRFIAIKKLREASRRSYVRGTD